MVLRVLVGQEQRIVISLGPARKVPGLEPVHTDGLKYVDDVVDVVEPFVYFNAAAVRGMDACTAGRVFVGDDEAGSAFVVQFGTDAVPEPGDGGGEVMRDFLARVRVDDDCPLGGVPVGLVLLATGDDPEPGVGLAHGVLCEQLRLERL